MTRRKARTTIAGASLFFVAACGLAVASCGSDSVPNHEAEDSITACIARGGTPQYTTDKYGDVIHFLGCVESKP